MEQMEVLKNIRMVKQKPENIKRIEPQTLIEHPEICFEVIRKDAENIKYIPISVREALPQVCIEAVKQKPENIMYVPENVQIENPQMCMDVVKKIKGIFYYISIDVLESNPEICLEALLKDSECYEDIPEEIIEEHPEIQMMKQVINDYTYVEQIPKKELRQFPQIYLKSLQEKLTKEKKAELYKIIDIDLIYNNPNLVERCFEQFGMYNYNLNSKLVAATQDIDFVKKILKEKRNSVFIDEIVEGFKDRDSLIDDLIMNKEEFAFTDGELAEIVLGKNDIKYAIDFFNNNIWQEDIETSLIHLPKGMTIGIEIESEGEASKQISSLLELFKDWEVHYDASLGDDWDYGKQEYTSGVEVVSPVLKAEEKNEKYIYKVCNFLNWADQSVSEHCGGHVHIGADYLKDIDAWKNLVEIWANAEKEIILMSNDIGDLPRYDLIEYAKPILGFFQDALDKGKIELDDIEDINEFCAQLSIALNDRKIRINGGETHEELLKLFMASDPARYSAINFENVGSYDKNTIEFRAANGTLDPQTWIENINLFGGIVAAAQEISDIQHKLRLGQELSENEIYKLDNYELLKKQISDEEKADALLELAIPIKNQGIYQKRYMRNSRMNESCYFDESNVLKPISIGRNKIGKLAFTGDEQITGEEYAQTVQIIQNELQQENNVEKE